MLTSDTQTASAAIPPNQDAPPVKENRRIQRIALPLPLRVEVKFDASTTWNEVTRLNDVSAFGAGFTLKRPIKRGRLVLLTVPMPRQLRSYDYGEPQYKIWGLVRRCIQVGRTSDRQEFSIGVAFSGPKPPDGFLDDPSKLYDTNYRDEQGGGFWILEEADVLLDDSHLPRDLRKQSRYFIPETLNLELVDEAGNCIFSELTVTENVSLGGASVFTTLKAEPGTFLRVTSDRCNITILSVVRGERVGADGITRLHLEFIDRFFPLEGIE